MDLGQRTESRAPKLLQMIASTINAILESKNKPYDLIKIKLGNELVTQEATAKHLGMTFDDIFHVSISTKPIDLSKKLYGPWGHQVPVYIPVGQTLFRVTFHVLFIGHDATIKVISYRAGVGILTLVRRVQSKRSAI